MKFKKKSFKKHDGTVLDATMFNDGMVNLTVRSSDGSLRMIVLTHIQRIKLIEHLSVAP